MLGNGLTMRQVRLAINRGLPSATLRRRSRSKLERIAIARGGVVSPGSRVDLKLENYREEPSSLDVQFVYSIFGPFEGFEPASCWPLTSGYLKALIESKFGRYVQGGAVIIAAALAGFDQSFSTSNSTRISVPKPLLVELGLSIEWRKLHRLPVVTVFESQEG